MTRRLISTGSPFEEAIGYSRAVVQGDWCFVSGITGYDYVAMALAKGPAAQTEACIATLDRVLQEAGFTLSDIVRMQYTLADREILDQVVPVLVQAFGEIRPAATMVIAGLMEPEMLVEIEATAFRS